MDFAMHRRGRKSGERVTVKASVAVDEALGQSEAFLSFQERLSLVAPIDRPVLLLGERGTGKELAASRLHYLSKRWQGPLVALNCAALNPTLIESELFGYEKGAFTGAEQRRTGRFETADQGTLFLDEIGNIPMEVQEKILRIVEYGIFERVGSSESIETDVRIVAATNADLLALTREGRFMQDLLDRLSFEVLVLPPLRERKEDIPLLAHHFAVRMAYELNREETPQFSDAAMKALERYQWPGNVRELKNLVERAVYRSEALLITEIVFDLFQRTQHKRSSQGKESSFITGREVRETELMNLPLKEAVRQLTLSRLIAALEEAKYNQRKAARSLGMSYHQFRGLYRKHLNEIENRRGG
jgi:psp operon transcriptional activator